MEQLNLIQISRSQDPSPRHAPREPAWQVRATDCDPVALRVAEALWARSLALVADGQGERALWVGAVARAWYDAACMVADRRAQKSTTIASRTDRRDARAFFLSPNPDRAWMRQRISDNAGLDLGPMRSMLAEMLARERGPRPAQRDAFGC